MKTGVTATLGEQTIWRKRRYDDAAKTYQRFHRLHPSTLLPTLSMRRGGNFTKGEIPQVRLESKRDFASKYGLQADTGGQQGRERCGRSADLSED